MDGLFIIHNYIITLQCAMLATNMNFYCYQHFHSMKFINNKLKLFSQLSNEKTKLLFSSIDWNSNANILYKLQFLHKIQSLKILFAFDKIWAFFWSLHLAIGIPFNVVCILNINNEKMDRKHTIIFLMIIVIHVSVISQSLFIMAWVTKTFHSHQKYLPATIFRIDYKKTPRLKFLYYDWFHRLISGKKYGPFISTIGNINYITVINVSFLLS